MGSDSDMDEILERGLTPQAIRPGYRVALATRRSVAGNAVWVGVVQEVDEHGVRLTGVDWLIGMEVGWDYYVPWTEIVVAQIATPDHSGALFYDQAAQFQKRVNSELKGAGEGEADD